MITHEEFIKKYNLKEGDYYQQNEWLRILYLNDFKDIIRIKELPSKIEFTNKCNTKIILRTKKIPSDVIFNNDGHMEVINVEEISENVIFNNNGDLLLGNLKDFNIGKLNKIHPSVKFTNNGCVYLYIELIRSQVKLFLIIRDLLLFIMLKKF